MDLEAATAPDMIAKLAAHLQLLGIRPMIQDLGDDSWMLDAPIESGLAAMVAHNLTFDPLVMPRHLTYLDQFLHRHPDLRVVVDHCAKPGFQPGTCSAWAEGIALVAAHPNTFAKLSGLLTEASAGTPAPEIHRHFAHVCACFGGERVLLGSDWPVLKLAGRYADWTALIAGFIDTRPDLEE